MVEPLHEPSPWVTAWKKRGGAWVLGQAVILGGYVMSLSLFDSFVALGELVVVRQLGLSLSVVALLWCAWSVIALRRSLSVYPNPTPSNVLVTRGPYRIVRHPIYSGLCVGLAGWALFRGAPGGLVVVVVLVGYLLAKAGAEERELKRRHPRYEQYMRSTKWRIFPGL